jgi:hypothetical protein
MSAESIESIESVESEIPKKAKRVLSEAQLNNLKLAREKAILKKKELGEITKREKQAKEDLLNERIKQVTKLEKATKKAPKKKVIESSSESSSDSSSESESSESSSEEEAPIKKSKARQSKKKRSTPIQRVKKHSNEKITTDIQKDELKQRILNNSYRSAYASLFPNAKNIF